MLLFEECCDKTISKRWTVYHFRSCDLSPHSSCKLIKWLSDLRTICLNYFLLLSRGKSLKKGRFWSKSGNLVPVASLFFSFFANLICVRCWFSHIFFACFSIKWHAFKGHCFVYKEDKILHPDKSQKSCMNLLFYGFVRKKYKREFRINKVWASDIAE